MVYDHDSGTYNGGKRRATDYKENVSVKLPRPMNHKREAEMLIRIQSYRYVVRSYQNEKGIGENQELNLSRCRKKGLM